jgi:hypothetical protein
MFVGWNGVIVVLKLKSFIEREIMLGVDDEWFLCGIGERQRKVYRLPHASIPLFSQIVIVHRQEK